MGRAVLSSFVAADGVSSVVVTDVRGEAARATAAEYLASDVTVTASPRNSEAVSGADVVVFAVKPQDGAEALDAFAASVRPGALLLTVAAGLPASFYEGDVRASPAEFGFL